MKIVAKSIEVVDWTDTKGNIWPWLYINSLPITVLNQIFLSQIELML
ncbi:hypothetical protein Ctaglu_16820 [Clostridium tagluense]|uniref:Uncharacterized protein n=1 Tax=Clostridium tagluense TaxID=360422 RepID=A0A401UKS3_9CLOT|nr:hypothetical protein Ctaglu_16820 [Clostridium tagluense]